MYDPTNAGYNRQNPTRFIPNYDLTVSDNPYTNSPYDLQHIPTPPKPPRVQHKIVFTLGIIIVVLLIIISGLVLGLVYLNNNKAPMSQNTATESPSTHSPHAKTTDYTAKSVLHDLSQNKVLIEVVSYNQNEVDYLNEYYKQLNDQVQSSPNDSTLLTSVTFNNCTDAIPLSTCGQNSQIYPDWLGVYATSSDAQVAYQETANINANSENNGIYALTSSSGNMYNTLGRCLLVGYDATSQNVISVLQNSCV